MAPITFGFDQSEINNLINDSQESENILISILSAKERPGSKSNLFLAAQLGEPGSHVAITKLKPPPPVGCPVPPGWSVLSPGITHSQLENSPKFIISASVKKTLLNNNAAATNGELLVSLEGVQENNTLQTKLSFKITDGNNNTVTIDAEVL